MWQVFDVLSWPRSFRDFHLDFNTTTSSSYSIGQETNARVLLFLCMPIPIIHSGTGETGISNNSRKIWVSSLLQCRVIWINSYISPLRKDKRNHYNIHLLWFCRIVSPGNSVSFNWQPLSLTTAKIWLCSSRRLISSSIVIFKILNCDKKSYHLNHF